MPAVRSAMKGASLDTGAPVQVSARGPFAVGSTIWRDERGQLTCTVVAKATYKLAPGESPLLDAPCPIQDGDAYWDDDPSQSVHVPSDLAPFKRAAEVVVVGSAFGGAGAASVVVHILVGGVDKVMVAFPPRHFRPDGSIDDGGSARRSAELRPQTPVDPGTPLATFPLRYEVAAGGPSTDNPVGIDVTRADARGRRPVPQFLPPFHAMGPPGTPM